MAKLPATSYVRMVDIWLTFTQLYPFLEVILYTIIELYNEEEETNHHGFKRAIPETQRQKGKWKMENYLHSLFIYNNICFQNKATNSWILPMDTNLYKISKGFGKYESFSEVLYGLDL